MLNKTNTLNYNKIKEYISNNSEIFPFNANDNYSSGWAHIKSERLDLLKGLIEVIFDK